MRHSTTRGLAALALISLSACGYNRIQTLDEQANKAQGQIEVQLQRRADLIPNLVETVKGYAKHEEDVLTKVTQARAGLLSAIQSKDPAKMADADAQVNTALRGLMVSVEAYPQLKADQSFIRLQDELTGTENRVAVSREDYNSAVNDYNAYIRSFPQVITAKATGAHARAYYKATSATANEAPKVDFTKKP